MFLDPYLVSGNPLNDEEMIEVINLESGRMVGQLVRTE